MPKQGTDTLNAKSKIDIISLSVVSLRKASVVRDSEPENLDINSQGCNASKNAAQLNMSAPGDLGPAGEDHGKLIPRTLDPRGSL